jgi:hypothetical protein
VLNEDGDVDLYKEFAYCHREEAGLVGIVGLIRDLPRTDTPGAGMMMNKKKIFYFQDTSHLFGRWHRISIVIYFKRCI